MKGINVGGKDYNFGPNGSMYISDSGVAKEIEQEYGHRVGNGDVTVSPVEFREPGHTYFFGSPGSQRYRDNFDAIFRKDAKDAVTQRQTEEQAGGGECRCQKELNTAIKKAQRFASHS